MTTPAAGPIPSTPSAPAIPSTPATPSARSASAAPSAPGAVSVPATRSEVSTVGSIAEGRTVIDVLDVELRALIARRLEISRRIQEIRLSSGRPRVEYSRESEIIRSWHEAFGQPGSQLAFALLTLCRGPGDAASAGSG
ncbi:hypothetical protein CcI49_35280 [Frankia sp. CcI49]|uniref:chorismate mutase n=1 Tax=Frankia sp. CcI49 TaxID=1745382 RepID=UPI0009781FA8|nr:chorismate mutase [Frankia sp. CcI49]ONH51670.1 hypothetical protein CcI49_35280 [Frankia sp. CcI49]